MGTLSSLSGDSSSPRVGRDSSEDHATFLHELPLLGLGQGVQSASHDSSDEPSTLWLPIDPASGEGEVCYSESQRALVRHGHQRAGASWEALGVGDLEAAQACQESAVQALQQVYCL